MKRERPGTRGWRGCLMRAQARPAPGPRPSLHGQTSQGRSCRERLWREPAPRLPVGSRWRAAPPARHPRRAPSARPPPPPPPGRSDHPHQLPQGDRAQCTNTAVFSSCFTRHQKQPLFRRPGRVCTQTRLAGKGPSGPRAGPEDPRERATNHALPPRCSRCAPGDRFRSPGPRRTAWLPRPARLALLPIRPRDTRKEWARDSR